MTKRRFLSAQISGQPTGESKCTREHLSKRRRGDASMAAQPAKTVTVAALAGAAFAVAYKATTKYLTKEEETPKSLDDSTKLDESTASRFYGITPSSLATRHEARSMDREKSERSLRLMVESKALAQASTTDYAGGTLGSRVKLVVAMVGLPARGKSYLVKMLVRYLSWVGFPTKIFNVGELRRKQGQAGAKAEYFADTPEAMAVREGLALQCQEEMYDWLRAQKGACVAIFDATNTTRHRRHLLTERCKAESDESGNDVSIVFVESICDDPKVLSRNYEMKLQNVRARCPHRVARPSTLLRRRRRGGRRRHDAMSVCVGSRRKRMGWHQTSSTRHCLRRHRRESTPTAAPSPRSRAGRL